MRPKTLEEFKKQLQKAITDQDIEKFKNLIYYCLFHSSPKYNKTTGRRYCPECPLSDENGPLELMGHDVADTCLLVSMRYAYWNYAFHHMTSKKTALAILVCDGIKLLAYLESKG